MVKYKRPLYSALNSGEYPKEYKHVWNMSGIWEDDQKKPYYDFSGFYTNSKSFPQMTNSGNWMNKKDNHMEDAVGLIRKINEDIRKEINKEFSNIYNLKKEILQDIRENVSNHKSYADKPRKTKRKPAPKIEKKVVKKKAQPKENSKKKQPSPKPIPEPPIEKVPTEEEFKSGFKWSPPPEVKPKPALFKDKFYYFGFFILSILVIIGIKLVASGIINLASMFNFFQISLIKI